MQGCLNAQKERIAAMRPSVLLKSRNKTTLHLHHFGRIQILNRRKTIIASLDDFKKYMHEMVHTGGFSQGFLMSRVPQNFKECTRKFLDFKHFSYKKLAGLVASYIHLVSVIIFGSGPSKA